MPPAPMRVANSYRPNFIPTEGGHSGLLAAFSRRDRAPGKRRRPDAAYRWISTSGREQPLASIPALNMKTS